MCALQQGSMSKAREVTWPGGTCDGPGALGFASRRGPFLGGIRHGAASEVRPGCPGRPPSPDDFVWRAAPTARRPVRSQQSGLLSSLGRMQMLQAASLKGAAGQGAAVLRE